MDKTSMPVTISRALEFGKAAHRLMSQRGQYGGGRPCALAWAIAFAQEDLSALAAGGQSDRYEELKRFSFDAGLAEAILQGDSQPQMLLNVSVEIPVRANPLQVLTEVQNEVKTRLDAYLRGEAVLLEEIRVSYEVTRTVDNPLSGRVLLHVHNLKDAVLLHLFHLLAELGSRIKACRRCAKIFLAGRLDKQFCSGSCQAMTWKENHLSMTKKRPHGKKRRGRTKTESRKGG